MKKAWGAALLCVAMGAQAEFWVPVATNMEGAISSVDTDSINEIHSGRSEAWVKTLYKKPQPMQPGKKGSPVYLEMLALRVYHCGRKKMSTQMLVFRGANGDAVHSDATPDTFETPIVPGSVGESLYELVCPPR